MLSVAVLGMALLWAGYWAESARAQDIIAPVDLSVTEGTDLRFVRLTDSLPAGVTCIVQDDQGFIWLGTENGLRRFDGYRFREFRNDPHNPDSLSGTYVYALFKDRSGTLWIGSDQFLDRYDPATDRVTHFPSDPDRFKGPVFQMREDAEGTDDGDEPSGQRQTTPGGRDRRAARGRRQVRTRPRGRPRIWRPSGVQRPSWLRRPPCVPRGRVVLGTVLGAFLGSR